MEDFLLHWTDTFVTLTGLSSSSQPNLSHSLSCLRQVNSSTVDGQTPLSEACARGHATCVSLLLQHGANPSGSGQSGSPIHRAAAQGQRSHCGADTQIIEAVESDGVKCRSRADTSEKHVWKMHNASRKSLLLLPTKWKMCTFFLLGLEVRADFKAHHFPAHHLALWWFC